MRRSSFSPRVHAGQPRVDAGAKRLPAPCARGLEFAFFNRRVHRNRDSCAGAAIAVADIPKTSFANPR